MAAPSSTPSTSLSSWPSSPSWRRPARALGRGRRTLVAAALLGLVGAGLGTAPVSAASRPAAPASAMSSIGSGAPGRAVVPGMDRTAVPTAGSVGGAMLPVAVPESAPGQAGPSHATGDRPEFGPYQIGAPHSALRTMRIGLRYSYNPAGELQEFYSFEHPRVEIAGTVGDLEVVDVASGTTVLTVQAGQKVGVSHDGSDFVVTGPDDTSTTVEGPVRFRGTDPSNLLTVPSIVRRNILGSGYRTPEYRGELEVARGEKTPSGLVHLVNVIELEDYVRGVVINESPASFHAEALKSQVVAARGYAVANVGRFVKEGYPFDLDDSALSQVYRGRIAEHANGNAAAEATTGLVATYQGDIISAYYSSSMAGHTENVEWSLTNTADPGQAVPYLVGRYDGPAGTEPDLSTEEGLRAFWTTEQSQVYDSRASSGNSRNRWSFTLTREQAEANLEARKDTAKVISGSATTVGDLKSCEATKRSPTGRIFVVRCTGSEAVWDFEGWDNVRRAFPSPTLGVLNNPTFIDHAYDDNKALTSITVIGGGWGHNVGMSQWGAHGRGRAGQSFGEIITFYYKDTSVGSYPIDLEVKPGSPRVTRQDFASPDGKGKLQVRNAKGLSGLTVVVNDDWGVHLDKGDLRKPLVEVDLTGHLIHGQNRIQYVPHGRRGSAGVLVEVYR